MSTALRQHQTDPLRLHFYTVAVRPPSAEAVAQAPAGMVDLRLLTDTMMQQVRAKAKDMLVDQSVRLTVDQTALAQKGIFFMQAPARFAEDVRHLEGIQSVDTPLNKRKSHPRRCSR